MPHAQIYFKPNHNNPNLSSPMPISLPALFRGFVLLALALHVFCMYTVARVVITGESELGFHFSTFVLAAIFGFIMLIPLVWAAWIPDLPEIYTLHVRARRWFKCGRCPACGYSASASHAPKCTECGCELVEPQPYAVKPRTIRLFIIITLFAWLLGISAGEVWTLADEAAFAREAAAHHESGRAEPYTRPRRWPGSAVSMTSK